MGRIAGSKAVTPPPGDSLLKRAGVQDWRYECPSSTPPSLTAFSRSSGGQPWRRSTICCRCAYHSTHQNPPLTLVCVMKEGKGDCTAHRLVRIMLACMGLQDAASTYLDGILGFETQPLVSTDYTNDRRSSVVDALSTQVSNSAYTLGFMVSRRYPLVAGSRSHSRGGKSPSG